MYRILWINSLNSCDLQYPLLTEGVRERVAFVLNAMHSYRHEWACQLVYSPRLRRGMALTDGEAVERFWSRIRKLIAITRHQWVGFHHGYRWDQILPCSSTHRT
jgi:hypothetical protein